MRRIALFVLFLAVYAGATAVLHRTLPGNEQPLLADKLDRLHSLPSGELPDLIFIGSSRVYHGFDPEAFDRRLAERGHDLRSFNLGITGLKLNGAVDVLKRLDKALEDERPRWILIDPESPETLRDQQRRSFQGVVNWYDPETVHLELSWILGSDMPKEAKFEAAQSLLHAFAFRSAAVGRATPLLDPWLERERTQAEVSFGLGPRANGFRTKDSSTKPGPHKKHRQFLRRLPRYERSLVAFRRDFTHQASNLEPLTDEGAAIFDRIASQVRLLGAEPIFVTQPATNLHGELRQAYEAGLVKHLLLLNDPIRYPELFAVEARWEEAHLSTEGAQRFTRALADAFADWIEIIEESER